MDKQAKRQKIDKFLKELREQDVNSFNSDIEGDLGKVLKHFAISCKKCGSSKIFVSWEDSVDYGGETGYQPGQKLFKCLDCGNSASFFE